MNWENIKLKNSDRKSLLDGIPTSAPALLRAQRLQERASKVSFDWNQMTDVIEKLEEELKELKSAINNNLVEPSFETAAKVDLLIEMIEKKALEHD